MAEVTYFVALPFVAADDGIAAGEPTECFNPVAVVMRAEAFVAQARTCWSRGLQPDRDPATGETFGDAKVIKSSGDVPDEGHGSNMSWLARQSFRAHDDCDRIEAFGRLTGGNTVVCGDEGQRTK